MTDEPTPSTSKSPQNLAVPLPNLAVPPPEIIQNAPPIPPVNQAELERRQANDQIINRLREFYLNTTEDEENFMTAHMEKIEAGGEDQPSESDKRKYLILMQRQVDRQGLENLVRDHGQDELEFEIRNDIQGIYNRMATMETGKEDLLAKSLIKITKKLDDSGNLTGVRPQKVQADPTKIPRRVYNIYDQTIGELHNLTDPTISDEERYRLYESMRLKDNKDMYDAMVQEFYDKIDKIPEVAEDKAFETIKSINAGSREKNTRYPIPEFGDQDYIKENGMKYIHHALRNRYFKSPTDHTISPSKLVKLHRQIVEHLNLDATQAVEVFYMFFKHGPILTIITDIADDEEPGGQLIRTLYDTILNYERHDNPTGVRVKLQGLINNIGRRPLSDTLTDIRGTCLKLYDSSPKNIRAQQRSASGLASIEQYLRNFYPAEKVDLILEMYALHMDREGQNLYNGGSINHLINIARTQLKSIVPRKVEPIPGYLFGVEVNKRELDKPRVDYHRVDSLDLGTNDHGNDAQGYSENPQMVECDYQENSFDVQMRLTEEMASIDSEKQHISAVNQGGQFRQGGYQRGNQGGPKTTQNEQLREKFHNRCFLCNGTDDHSPIFYSHCCYFENMQPDLRGQPQKCCGGLHGFLRSPCPAKAHRDKQRRN